MSIVSVGQNTIKMFAVSPALHHQISARNVAVVENQRLQHMRSSLGRRNPNQKRHIYKPVCKESIVLANWGWFGSVHVRVKTASLCVSHEEETPISEEKTFTIHPSFIQKAIEVCQQRNGDRVSRSLRYYPILPVDSTIFALCRNGDLKRFKTALTRNEVPISGQTWSGRTLLHFACQSTNVELISLLIRLGVDPDHVDRFGRKAIEIFSNCVRKSSDCVETTIRLLATSQRDLTDNDIDKCLECYIGPPEGLECMLSPDMYPVELDWRYLPLS